MLVYCIPNFLHRLIFSSVIFFPFFIFFFQFYLFIFLFFFWLEDFNFLAPFYFTRQENAKCQNFIMLRSHLTSLSHRNFSQTWMKCLSWKLLVPWSYRYGRCWRQLRLNFWSAFASQAGRPSCVSFASPTPIFRWVGRGAACRGASKDTDPPSSASWFPPSDKSAEALLATRPGECVLFPVSLPFPVWARARRRSRSPRRPLPGPSLPQHREGPPQAVLEQILTHLSDFLPKNVSEISILKQQEVWLQSSKFCKILLEFCKILKWIMFSV